MGVASLQSDASGGVPMGMGHLLSCMGKSTLYLFMRPYTVPLCGFFMRVLYAMAYTTLCCKFLEKALCQALCVMD